MRRLKASTRRLLKDTAVPHATIVPTTVEEFFTKAEAHFAKLKPGQRPQPEDIPQ